MSKKRKILPKRDLISTRDFVAETAMETTEVIGQTLTSVRNQNSQDTDIIRKKKIKKDKNRKEHRPASNNTLDSFLIKQDIAISQESETATKKKKKKREKNKEIDDAMVNSQAIRNDFSVTATDQDVDCAYEHLKKKKKKKSKETKNEIDVDGTAVGSHVSEASKVIGAVDTDILKQASVNLGLPLADHESNDMQVQAMPKKAKKKQKKKDKEKQKLTKTLPEVGASNPNNGAVSYLRLWQTNRNTWKFNKHLQIKLIHNMYNKEKLSDEDFEVLLLYLDGLRGKGREKTKEEAGQIVTKDLQGTDEVKQERARLVFQMLS